MPTSRTSLRLTKEEELEYASLVPPLADGETTNVSHDECGDTRRRLYITKKKDGVGIAWCHNCAKWGILKQEGTIRRVLRSTSSPPALPKKDKLQMADLKLVNVLPYVAEEYLRRYNMFESTSYKFQWDTLTDRLAIPVYVDSGTWLCEQDIVGYQLRDLKGGGPKYITIKKDQSESLQRVIGRGGGHLRKEDPIIITEDIISALLLKINTTFDTIPLLGLSMHIETALKIKDNYKVAVVWLDNDKPEVIEAANKIKSLLSMMGVSTYVVKDHQDPKLYPNADVLRSIISKEVEDSDG